MEMELIVAFISEKALILIPTIYLLGMFLKSLDIVPDRYIPTMLLIFGIVLSMLLNGRGVDSFISGVLCSGVAVFFNQMYKQLKVK